MSAPCPTVRIGGIGFRERPGTGLPLPYRAFAGEGATDVEITVHRRPFAGDPPQETLFDARPNWWLGRCDEALWFRTMTADALWDRQRGSIGLHPRRSADSGGITFFSYPLAELVTLSLLAERGGLLLHACGVLAAGRVLLFAGPSGAGKSTMARLWRHRGYDILSDDRIILRTGNGSVTALGTPWHGDAGSASPAGATAAACFFLGHGAAHRATVLSPAAGAAELVRNSFSPYWDRDGMERLLASVETISGLLPCYRLDFTPAADIVDAVLEVLA
ncbi:MAG: hypothetical protein AB1568_11830 [Thermodesulfobacteriota bacterium]